MATMDMTKPLETMTIEEIEAELKEQEASRYNSSRYVLLCDYLGVEPNLWDFYYESTDEYWHYWDLADSYLEEPKRKKRDGEFLAFLEAAEKGHISEKSYEADVFRKRRILEKHFPEEYGYGGHSPMCLWRDRDVGFVFREMKKTARIIKEEIQPVLKIPEVITRLFVNMEGVAGQ